MKKIYLLLTFIISCFSFGQTNIFNLAGGGAFPSGWVGTNGITTNLIDRGTYFLLDAAVVGTDIIDSSTYDLSAYTSATISINVATFGSGTNNPAKIEVSFDGGVSYTQTIITATPTAASPYVVGTPVALTSVSNLVKFRFTNNGAGAAGKGVRMQVIKLDALGTNPELNITSPVGGTIFNPETTNVNVGLNIPNFNTASGGTGDGYIRYTINGGASFSKFDETPIAIPTTPGPYAIYAELVDNTGTVLSPPKNATVSFTVAAYTVVADIAALRADVTANGIGRYYQLSSNPIVSYARTARNQKYVQDATAGVLIDDNTATITTPMVIGDAVAGLKGQSVLFAGILQINPIANATVSSNSNPVNVQDVTLADFQTNYANYESEMIRITDDVAFSGNNANFVLNTNYPITSGANTVQFRAAFTEAPYIGTASPTTAQNITGLGAKTTISSVENPAIFAPTIADATLSKNTFNAIEGLAIYPNPVTGKSFQITSATNTSMSVSIYDVVGKEVLASKVINNTVNIEALNTGIYIVKVTEEGKTATRKLIVE